MVVYYSTASNVFAVSNGYCSQVMDRQGMEIDGHALIGRRLLGGVPHVFAAMVPEEAIVVGTCLKFDLGGAMLTTEPVTSIEEAPSLSIRPQAMELPPASIQTVETAPGRSTMESLPPTSRKA